MKMHAARAALPIVVLLYGGVLVASFSCGEVWDKIRREERRGEETRRSSASLCESLEDCAVPV